jgi:hypothetical protein
MSVMYVATLDILTEKGGFNPQAAECRRLLSEAIGTLRVGTDGEISALRSALESFRAELKADMSALRAELKADMSALRAELEADIGALRAELRVGLQTMKADLVRWVFVVILGQTAMLLGVLYFFMKYMK